MTDLSVSLTGTPMTIVRQNVPDDIDTAADEAPHPLGPPFRVIAWLRNNRIIRARTKLGYASVKAAAEAIGIPPSSFYDYEAMRLQPWNREGGWKESALALATGLRELPEDLWPEEVARVSRSRMEAEVGFAQLQIAPDWEREATRGLLRGKIDAVLGTLAPRERSVIERRFGLVGDERTLDEIGEEDLVSRERIRQVEAKALRRLRHPKVSKRLKSLWEEPTGGPAQKPYVCEHDPPHPAERFYDHRGGCLSLPYCAAYTRGALDEVRCDEETARRLLLGWFKSFEAAANKLTYVATGLGLRICVADDGRVVVPVVLIRSDDEVVNVDDTHLLLKGGGTRPHGLSKVGWWMSAPGRIYLGHELGISVPKGSPAFHPLPANPP